jgi:hypothetical protein
MTAGTHASPTEGMNMKVWQVAIVKTSGSTMAEWQRSEKVVGNCGSREAAFRAKAEQERMLKWAPRPNGERFVVQIRER